MRLGKNAGPQHLAAYLSGAMEGEFSHLINHTESLSSRARSAARRIPNRVKFGWRWTNERGELAIECRDQSEDVVMVPPVASAQIIAWSRTTGIASLPKNIKERCSDILPKESEQSLSSGGRIALFADWRFIHRARLNVLPLNGVRSWVPNADKRCRRCGANLESLTHVLQHCGPGQRRTQRHSLPPGRGRTRPRGL
jgi:hypothetical protein